MGRHLQQPPLARRRALLLLTSFLALALNDSSTGQDCDANASISVGHASAAAGKVSVELFGNSLCGVTGFSLAIRHDAKRVEFVRAEPGPFLKEHVGRHLFFTVDEMNSRGFMSLFVVFGFTTPPVSIPEPSILARLFYRIKDDIPPGRILLRNESRKVGSPPIANIFTTRRSAIEPRLQDGSITISSCDASASMSVGHASAPSGELSVDLLGSSFCPVTGFNLAVGHDATRVRFLRAEPGPFLQSQAGVNLVFLAEEHNNEGFMSLRVAFDKPESTTLTSLTIPEDSILAALFYEIRRGARPGEFVLRNEGGVFGDPPIANAFTTEESVLEPELDDGSITITEFVEPLSEFQRGDANADGILDLSDAVTIITCRTPEAVQPPCEKAADANDDGKVDLADALHMLSFLSGLGPAPPAPFLQCGLDETPDQLSCRTFPRCPSA